MCVFILLQAVSVSAENASADPSDLITYTKELFSIGQSYDEFDYTYTLDEESGLTSYRFNWENTGNGLTVTVSIDENKYISYYNKSEQDYSGLGIVTPEEAGASAESFLSLVVPEEYSGNLEREAENRGNKYYITYRYNVNGIPFDAGLFVFRVSKYSGEVLYYDAPDECPFYLSYPEAENIISAETAHGLYKDICELVFEYRDCYDRQEQGYRLFPAYYIDDYTSNMIDAFTGESIETEYYEEWADASGSAAAYDTAEEETAEEDFGLSKAEIASIDDKTDILTAEEALAIVEKEISIPDKTNLRSELQKNSDGEYIWRISLNSSEAYISMSVNADTGRVISYFDSSGVYESDTAPDYNIMLETAERLGQAFSGEMFYGTELEYGEDSYENGLVSSYSFRYIRTESGIKYRDNYILTEFDAEGKITEYYTIWNNNIIDFPDTEGAIGLEAAYDRFFEAAVPVLAYVKTDTGIRLAYVFNYSEVCLDKQGGRIDPYDGTPYTEEEEFTGYTDIEGSRYEEIIKLLYNNGYYLERSEFKPDEPITPADFSSLFGIRGSQTEQGYKFNCVSDKYYGENLTRYETAEILASFKVETKILSSDVIYTSQYYKDEIAPEYLPHVAICYILGYMTGDSSGCFNGEAVLTNGEAAVILYNYLTS